MQVEPHRIPPADVLAVGASDETGCLAAVLGDERQRGELDVEQGGYLVEQRPARCRRVLRSRQRAGEAGDGIELAVAQRDELLGLAGPRAAHDDMRAIAPAQQEQERRSQRDQGPGERQPDLPPDRRAFVEDDRAEDRRGDSDAGEHQRERQIRSPDSAPLAPEAGQQGSAHEQVRGREDEQRHGVEIDSLVLGGHWALLMIRSAVSGVEPIVFP